MATRGRCADSPSTLIFTLGPMVNWGRVGTGFSPECDAAGLGCGWGERRGESGPGPPTPATARERVPLACALPPPPGSQGSPKAGEPRMGSRLEAACTHWRRSRRTPSSSDTSSAGCGWAWLRRRLGLSHFLPIYTPCPHSESLLTVPRPICPSGATSFSSSPTFRTWITVAPGQP